MDPKVQAAVNGDLIKPDVASRIGLAEEDPREQVRRMNEFLRSSKRSYDDLVPPKVPSLSENREIQPDGPRDRKTQQGTRIRKVCHLDGVDNSVEIHIRSLSQLGADAILSALDQLRSEIQNGKSDPHSKGSD